MIMRVNEEMTLIAGEVNGGFDGPRTKAVIQPDCQELPLLLCRHPVPDTGGYGCREFFASLAISGLFKTLMRWKLSLQWLQTFRTEFSITI